MSTPAYDWVQAQPTTRHPPTTTLKPPTNSWNAEHLHLAIISFRKIHMLRSKYICDGCGCRVRGDFSIALTQGEVSLIAYMLWPFFLTSSCLSNVKLTQGILAIYGASNQSGRIYPASWCISTLVYDGFETNYWILNRWMSSSFSKLVNITRQIEWSSINWNWYISFTHIWYLISFMPLCTVILFRLFCLREITSEKGCFLFLWNKCVQLLIIHIACCFV